MNKPKSKLAVQSIHLKKIHFRDKVTIAENTFFFKRMCPVFIIHNKIISRCH